jgi:hypothetical protein
MDDGPMEYIYWLLMNFPDNFLTSFTCIEKVNLPSSHIGKIYYINSGLVTFPTHILCVSLESWVMDRQMECIYWLLMNFPDNFLTSYTCIEQVNLPSSHIGKNILYQQRDSDIPNKHIICLSWIMGDGPMEYIYWLLMNFPDNLLTSCTCIEKVNLPSSPIGKIYYINSRIVTFLTHILCVYLESWLTDQWNTSVDFLWTFLIIFSRVALVLSRSTYLPVTLEKYIISTAG